MLGNWLDEFRYLHERGRQGTLGGWERERYHALRDECARLICKLQQISVPPDWPARRSLRVARALQVDIAFTNHAEHTVTADVSAGGFGAFLSRAPAIGAQADVELRLTGSERVACKARVVSVRTQGVTTRGSFEFVGLDDAQAERLQTLVFDVVLEVLGRQGPPRKRAGTA